MGLWIAMAVLAAAAALVAMAPLFRARETTSVSLAAGEIYKDQLNELRRDVEDGRIATGEAEAARVEIARRLIHAQAGPDAAKGSARLWRRLSIAVIAIAPLAAFAGYMMTGSPQLSDSPLAARMAASPERSDIMALVARTEDYLARNPQDGAGWEVIGPIYLRMGRYDDAVTAFTRTVDLLGSTVASEANLGEAITAANDGNVVDGAQAAFRRAIALDPGHARSRFYLARALEQGGRDNQAAQAWRALLADAPPGAAWVGVARTALEDINVRLGVPAPAAAAAAGPAPTAGDIAAAADLSDTDRTAMIEGMVASLADRLEGEPDDAPGWARLIRSYVVLGKRPQAEQALADARSALVTGSDGRALVEATADEMELTAPEGRP